MNVILLSVQGHYALVYLDEICVILRSSSGPIALEYWVLNLSKNTEVTLKLRKCRFPIYVVVYLGRSIRPRRSKIASQATDANEELKRPTIIAELHSSLNLCSAFQRIVLEPVLAPHLKHILTERQ